jgi:hypothetical protein
MPSGMVKYVITQDYVLVYFYVDNVFIVKFCLWS